MILHPSQSTIARSRKRFRVVNCGRRFGKTSLSIYEMAGKAYTAPDRKVCYIAPTYQQARDIAWVELMRVVAPIAVKVNETRLEITVQTQPKKLFKKDGTYSKKPGPAGSSLIMLRGWESIDTLRGQHFDFIVIDEIASMRNWETNWNTIIRPTLTDTRGEVLFISTPKGFNHFYDLYNLSNDPLKGADYASFHFTSYDNPHIPKDELDKARKEMSEDQFAQEYLADFRKQEGLVYKEFDRHRHLYEGNTDNPEDPTYAYPRQLVGFMAGIDFGYTNPAAVLHIRKDSDNHYWVEDMLYRKGLTDAKVADYVKSKSFDFVFPDPENPAAIEELNSRSINIREVTKGRDSVQNGISRVRELFKQGRLHIHKRCTDLIEELESYHYPEGSSDRNARENPEKSDDHSLDALRYVIMTDDPYIMEESEPFTMYKSSYS